MDRTALAFDLTGQNGRLADTIRREQGRLRSFIRTRVADIEDAEDILQDVFCELIEAAWLMKPVSTPVHGCSASRGTHYGPVPRKARAVDRCATHRCRATDLLFEDLLPSTDAGPDAAHPARPLDELNAATDDPPSNSGRLHGASARGRSFKTGEETGVTSTRCSRASTTPSPPTAPPGHP